MQSPPPEAPFPSYGTKTVATVITFTRSFKSMHAMAPAGGSVFKLRHQDRRHCHHLHQIYQIHACDGPRRRLRFQVTAPRPSPLLPPSPDLSDPCMRRPPPEAPFSSYGTKTVATVTTFTRSIRPMRDGPRRRLLFQVTAPRPSPLSPPSPDLSDPCMRRPPPEAPFSSYGTKTIASVTTFTRSIRSYMRWPSPEAPFSSYGTKTVATVTTFTRSIRFMHAMAPAGGSVFKLWHQDRCHCHHLHQIYQIHACDGLRRRLRFQVQHQDRHRCQHLHQIYQTHACDGLRRRLCFQVRHQDRRHSQHFTRSIRPMRAMASAGGSVFKLRHQDRRHCHHLHQIYQTHTCDGRHQRLRFQVTAPRPLPLSPPSPDLSDLWNEHPCQKLMLKKKKKKKRLKQLSSPLLASTLRLLPLPLRPWTDPLPLETTQNWAKCYLTTLQTLQWITDVLHSTHHGSDQPFEATGLHCIYAFYKSTYRMSYNLLL